MLDMDLERVLYMISTLLGSMPSSSSVHGYHAFWIHCFFFFLFSAPAWID